MIRVLLVDDNAIVRRGVASLLEDEDDVEVVGEAADGREAIARAQELSPDVVCLDVRMPVMDGIEAAAVLSRDARVLMLTYAEEEELVGGAIRAGASGYLLHGRFTPDELAGRIREVAAGETVLSPAVMPTVFDAVRRGASARGERDRDALTEREEEVVALLARGMSNAEIAGQLVVTHKTVKNHVAHVYAKLGVHSRAEAVATWLGIKEGGTR
jgi:DNA-binding NarL/FixJ family response regulator